VIFLYQNESRLKSNWPRGHLASLPRSGRNQYSSGRTSTFGGNIVRRRRNRKYVRTCGGVANENSQNNSAATPVVIEQFLNCAIPVPNVGRLRGAAQTAASVDTLTELALIIGDFTLIDYNATGASDGGQLYTIIEVAVADTAGLEIVGGNTALSTLDAVVDARAYRLDVT